MLSGTQPLCTRTDVCGVVAQAARIYANSIDCVKKTIMKEGVAGFYKGGEQLLSHRRRRHARHRSCRAERARPGWAVSVWLKPFLCGTVGANAARMIPTGAIQHLAYSVFKQLLGCDNS